MPYSVRVLSVGESNIHGSDLFWRHRRDETFPLAFNVTVIVGDGIVALVNTSPPDDDTEVRALFPDMRFLHDAPDGDLVRDDSQHIDRALADVGLTVDDVSHVILTPLELYTTGTLNRFRRATICLSKRGWIHFHTTHDHFHDSRWRTFPRDVLIDLVTTSWDRVRLLDDEDEIAPGLRTWWSGAHHRESMVVEADTSVGTVAVSDSFFYYENVEDGRLLGLCENMYEALECNERVLQVAQHIVPIHDPKVFDRYQDGIIAP
jgi:hypothetical protein